MAGVLIVVLGSAGTGEKVSFTGSGDPNFNASNTRFSGGPITGLTVKELHVAWKLPLTAKSQYGTYSSSPIVADGVIYSQDLDSNVQAIDLKTGKVLWTKDYESADQGPNGLWWPAGACMGPRRPPRSR